MTTVIINPFQNSRWNKFVGSHPKATIFHTANWARVLYRTYKYTPYYISLEDSNKNIKAGWPFFFIESGFTGNRFICLPFTDSCHPLITSEDDYKFMINTVFDLIKDRRISYLETRGGKGASSLLRNNYYKIFTLELSSGIDRLWQGLKQKSIRYPINKAKKTNIIIEMTKNFKDLKEFYTLNLQTRKKHGVIPQPFDFFKNIFEEIISKEYGFLSLAYIGKKLVAGSIFLTYKDTIYHKYNASDIDYLSLCPNHLIIWQAIEWAAKNNFKYFDFGRTAPDNIGLISFKRHWGTQEFDLPYYYWPEIKGITSTKESSLRYRVVSSLIKKMPIALCRIMGDLFYRHLG